MALLLNDSMLMNFIILVLALELVHMVVLMAEKEPRRSAKSDSSYSYTHLKNLFLKKASCVNLLFFISGCFLISILA